MYKIHINDTPLTIVSGKDGDDYNKAMKQGSLVAPFPGKKKFLLHYIDLLEKSKNHQGVLLVASDFDDAVSLIESLFKEIRAAGGLVVNPENEILFIKRRGIWDLPKGKIEKGESVEEAAIREVVEETNLKDVEILEQLPVTRHTYKLNNQRILKLTYWFVMSSKGEGAKPQAEEEITDLMWQQLERFRKGEWETFRTIEELLGAFR